MVELVSSGGGNSSVSEVYALFLEAGPLQLSCSCRNRFYSNLVLVHSRRVVPFVQIYLAVRHMYSI